MLKIALVHDYIKEYGGAERVLEALHEIYPSAPVFTLVYCPEFLGPHKERFKNWEIHTSILQFIPLKHKLISIFRLLAPFIFKPFDFSGYDVVLVSATGAYAPNMITKGKAKQICYCHTPPRYLYGYATAREWKKNLLILALASVLNLWLKKIDKQSSRNVDQYIANSEEVRGRIKRFYGKDAVIVYPPVEINSKLKIQNSKLPKKYFLAGGRLARPKHYELIIKACARMDVNLKIFGKGFAGFEEELKKTNQELGNKAEFLGEVTDEEKLALMANAKAFIIASEDEDFGIVPVEAMGVGTPVIAYKSGGLKETVIDNKTGIFFNELNEDSIVDAIKRFEKTKIRQDDCISQAEKFSKEKFMDNIKKIVRAIGGDSHS